jgi:glycosyl transferase family 87
MSAPGSLLAIVSRRRFLIRLSAAALLAYIAIVIWLGFRGDWAFDFTCCYQQAGQRLLNGEDLYAWSDTYTFRYTPWAALLLAVFAPLPAWVAILAWLALKGVVLALAAALFARAWTGSDRSLAFGLAAFFPPAMHDLMIGNVSTFTLAVEVMLLRLRPAVAGSAFGLLLLLVPKPHLVPILAWLLLRQTRTGLIALGVGGAGVVAGLAVFGMDPWLGFIGTLREPLGRDFTANIALSGILGPVGVVVSGLLAAGLFGMAVLRRGPEGLGYAILSGIVLGPYTFIHYLVGLLVAAEPMLRARPRRLVAFPLLYLIAPLSHVWTVLLGIVTWVTLRGNASSGADD